MPVHVIFECFAPINKDHGHFIRVLLPKFRIVVDVHFTPLKLGLALKLRERLLKCLAEMTSFTRIHHHIVHMEILVAGSFAFADGLQ